MELVVQTSLGTLITNTHVQGTIHRRDKYDSYADPFNAKTHEFYCRVTTPDKYDEGFVPVVINGIPYRISRTYTRRRDGEGVWYWWATNLSDQRTNTTIMDNNRSMTSAAHDKFRRMMDAEVWPLFRDNKLLERVALEYRDYLVERLEKDIDELGQQITMLRITGKTLAAGDPHALLENVTARLY